MQPHMSATITKPQSKTEYILSALRKLQHKRHEQYVISGILHKLDDLSIEFICQQYLVPDNKAYLLDLYFPQFGLYVEIHEPAHANIEKAQEDKIRNTKIETVFGLRLFVIKTYLDEFTLLNIEQINLQIDTLVNLIKKEKLKKEKAGEFIPWDYDKKFDPTHHARHGILRVEAEITLLKQVDVIKMFGVELGALQRGAWDWKGTDYDIWFPKLFRFGTWDNSFADDGATIIESKLGVGKPYDFTNKKTKRVVFPHFKDQFGNRYYKFVGVFEIDRKASRTNHIVYRRIATAISLNK